MGWTPSKFRRYFRAWAQRKIVGLYDLRYRNKPSVGRTVTWVVGPKEVANMAMSVAQMIPGSFTMLIFRHRFYSGDYDYLPPEKESRFGKFRREWFDEPRLFVQLANAASGFIYLSENPYLRKQRDYRRFEFNFLKQHGVKIVCYFTGSDIRSVRLMEEHEVETGERNIARYLPFVSASATSPTFDSSRKQIARVADDLADLRFTMRVDQLGYLTGPTEPFMYFLPDERVLDCAKKFDSFERPIVLHIPSQPILKGTQLVHAAIDKLKSEGNDFEYVELIQAPHAQVLAELERAHIVLNEFYAHVPGVFGVEAMAAGCVVLQSADETVEPDLPQGSNGAWVVTKHWQVYDNLKSVLEQPERMAGQANAAQEWVRQHAVSSQSGARLLEMLDGLLKAES